MRKALQKTIVCALAVLFGSWASTFGAGVATKPILGQPVIVAAYERLDITGRVAPITIYTPQQWGTFRVPIVMVGTVANGQSNAFWDGNLAFTDGAGENGPFFGRDALLYTDMRRTGVAEFPIRAKAGKPMKFSVTPFGDTSGTKYNVWVVVGS